MTNTPSAATHNFRVLLVQQDVPLARRIVEYFSHVGLDCHHIAGGYAVPDALVKVKPHLVVLDTAESGYGHKVLHEIHHTCRVPIIVLMHKENFDTNKAATLPMVDDYVLKPVEPRHLALRVMAHLSQINPPSGPGRSQLSAGWLPYGWACCEACSYRGRVESLTSENIENPGCDAVPKAPGECHALDEQPGLAPQIAPSCPRCGRQGTIKLAPR